MSDFTPLHDFGPVPDGWLWGTATAAHQIEGGNVNNDWWRFEHTPGSGTAESSGDACDSWNRWRDDLALVAEMGLDAYRFSLEWSRIEPAQGEYSIAALEHYRAILMAAREMGIATVVTFHHFTTPLWMTDKGGWDNPDIVHHFARYCAKTVHHLGDLIDMACTINEPNVVALLGHHLGIFAPGLTLDVDGFARVTANFVAAHEAAREVLRAGPGEFPIGLTLAMSDVVIHLDGTWDGPAERLGTNLPTDEPMATMAKLMVVDYLESARADDFVGVQSYFDHHVAPDGTPLAVPDHERTTMMGWLFTPATIGQTIRAAAAIAQVPVIITENGVATSDDSERIEYLSGALESVRSAMDDGIDVRGYFVWSLLDNFEWAEGFRPTFGIAAVDGKTFDRTLRPSGRWFGDLAARSR